jgi:rRNA maturation endonuclease Nob1
MMDFIKSLPTEKTVVQEAQSFEEIMFARLEKAANKIAESNDDRDTITLDVPLLIRVFELVREGAKTDVDVHNITERLIAIKERGVLTMDDYGDIAGDITQGQIPEPQHEDIEISALKALAGLR